LNGSGKISSLISYSDH